MSLIWSPYSLLRAMEYEILQREDLQGLVLDAGGGSAQSSYLSLLRVHGQVESVNIDPARQPTYVADLNQPLPLEDGRYDTIISLNTLEHIHHDAFALSELARVLKPGGRMLLFVPFLYRIHGSPSDYHRHSAGWWETTLSGLGLTPSITPLGRGRYVAAYALAEPSRGKAFFRSILFALDYLDRQLRPAARTADADYPLGYVITAGKSGKRPQQAGS
jgi:SAM-dependent methyltransferase